MQIECCRCCGSCAHVMKSGGCCCNSCVHVNMSGVSSCDSSACVNMSGVRCCDSSACVNMSGVKCCDKYGGSVSMSVEVNALHSGAPVDPMVLEDVTEIPPGSLTAGWELEACEPDSMGEVVVKGRLKKHISFWKEEIKAPAAILDTIEVGYILPLKSEPTPYFRANHQSTSEHSTFVQESVAQLCSTGCVTEVHTRPFICSPLSVVVGRAGKERLVINLRHLNKFLWKQKFKYEDLRVAMLLFEKGDFLFSFDLKSGYHHVDIAKEHCAFLCLQYSHLASRRPAICSPSWCVP